MRRLSEKQYPVGAPDVGPLEEANVAAAVRSTWVSSSGPFLEEFERRFAEACETEHAMTCSNGTVALHLALAALGVGPDDEVIVPSLTYVATANAVRYTGATPIFCEVDPRTWCLDVADVAAHLGPRTKAIIAVHLYGHPADMDALSSLARDAGVYLVEDAAEAPFASIAGKTVGGLGSIATFSFYGNKIITSGEGGAVTTNDAQIAEKVRLLRGQGMDPQRRYFFPVVGYNYRLTNVAAAMLCAQLDRAEELVARRREVFRAYEEAFAAFDFFETQQVAVGVTTSPWMFTALLSGRHAARRDDLMSMMSAKRVETRPIFYPLHRLPAYRGECGRDLEVTDSLSSRGLSLPTSSTMTADDAREVAARVVEGVEAL